MRIASQSTTVIYLSRSASFGRRPLAPMLPQVTCLALCVHDDSRAKALLISDNADPARAVWCPRSLLSLDPCVRGDFVVATMSKRLAEQKGLWPRAVDTEGWLESRIIALRDAEGRAARKRNQLRAQREAAPRLGQNAFA
jgi:hypothetical protein